jgi:hypothetical protein
MEASADFIFKNSNSNFSLNREEQLNSIDVSSSDPIPPLFVPKNTIQKKQTSIIDEIISRIYENPSNKKTKKTQENININEIKQIIREKISIAIPLMNLQKHNSTPDKKDIMLINDLIESKETHFIATFKDYLISDFHEEFLRRYFNDAEIKDILPKFYLYYKNYLNFFCKGTFCDFNLNEIMQEYGECQAEFYYNKNYGHKERMKKKEKDKKGLDDMNHQNNEESYESENLSNVGNIKSIFSKSIKYSIDLIQNSYKDLSNIKPSNYSKDNSISLPDNSSVSYNDIITNQNSLRYIINIINNKNDLGNYKIKNKKSEIINNKKKFNNNGDNINYILNNNYKKISNNNLKNRINKKDNQTLSKTNSNINMKSKGKTKIKNNNAKINNYLINNINYKSKGNSSVSNYKKYIDFLTNKQRNKSNDPKIKISQDEFTFSLQKINKNKKAKNIISSLSPNGIINHFNFFSTNNNFNTNKKEEAKKVVNNNMLNNNLNNNKINPSLFLINNIFNKTSRNSNKYSTIFPLSTSKNNINKNKNRENKTDYNYNTYNEKKKIKNSHIINPNNKFMYFNPNISIKSVKSLSPSARNNSNIINNNNLNNNANSLKPLSYSTVNNCNININNNIILSNNYYNSKNHHQINSLTKKKLDKNLKQKTSNTNNNYINKSITKYTHSRNNNRNDLNRFKTEVNILNLLSQEKEKANNKNMNNTNYNNQYKSFRKSNNNEIFSKMKKNTNNQNRNLSLKNIPVTLKSNLNNNFSMNKTGKILDEYDLNVTNKPYKHFCLKKNSNIMNHNKIIFDYKRK